MKKFTPGFHTVSNLQRMVADTAPLIAASIRFHFYIGSMLPERGSNQIEPRILFME